MWHTDPTQRETALVLDSARAAAERSGPPCFHSDSEGEDPGDGRKVARGLAARYSFLHGWLDDHRDTAGMEANEIVSDGEGEDPGDGREVARDHAVGRRFSHDSCGSDRATVSAEIMRRAAHFREPTQEGQVAWRLDGCPHVPEDEEDSLVRRQCQELNARYEAGSDITMSSLESLASFSDESSQSDPDELEEPVSLERVPVEPLSPKCAWGPCGPTDHERACALGSIREALLRKRGARRGPLGGQVGAWAPSCAEGSGLAPGAEGAQRPSRTPTPPPGSQPCAALDTFSDSESTPDSLYTRCGHCDGMTIVSTREPSPCESGWTHQDAGSPDKDPREAVDKLKVAMMEWRQRREQRREQRRASAKAKRTYGVWLREQTEQMNPRCWNTI
jgi:hypothetical protein